MVIGEYFPPSNTVAQLCWDTGPRGFPTIWTSEYEGQFVAWCQKCKKWNIHSRIEGHRTAHCKCDRYYIRLVGPIDQHIARDLNRKKPLGPTDDSIRSPKKFRVVVLRPMRFNRQEFEKNDIVDMPVDDAMACICSTRAKEFDIIPTWARLSQPLLPGIWLPPVTAEMTTSTPEPSRAGWQTTSR
jgi:hypothetical protein